jgi:hypothetical protein
LAERSLPFHTISHIKPAHPPSIHRLPPSFLHTTSIHQRFHQNHQQICCASIGRYQRKLGTFWTRLTQYPRFAHSWGARFVTVAAHLCESGFISEEFIAIIDHNSQGIIPTLVHRSQDVPRCIQTMVVAFRHHSHRLSHPHCHLPHLIP